jgi:hypothetical protein
LGCRAGEDTLLVSTDSCFHRPAWIPEVAVKSAKFHTCSQTTASMRSKPDVHAQVFDPVFLAPGLRHDRVQAGIGVGADGVADDVDSASSSGMAGAPTSFVNGRRQYAPTTSTLTAAVKTAKAQPNLDVPYRPAQVDDNQADAAVLPAWSPERAFRRPTLLRASGL